MAYSANQYNYATPLSSAAQLTLETTSGAQMLDFDAWVADIAQRGGIVRGTYTVDTDAKFITITATDNDAFTPYNIDNGFRIPVKPNTKYSLTCQRRGATASGSVFLFENGDVENFAEATPDSTDIKLSLTTSANATFLTFRVGVWLKGQTSSFSEIMISEGEPKSYERFTCLVPYPNEYKFFKLIDNTLDGTCKPISGDIGIWGSTLSDSNGNLSEPLVVTVAGNLSINSFKLQGGQDNYPVDFMVKFYNDSTEVYSISEASNTSAVYTHHPTSTIVATHYVVTVTKISAANSVAVLYSLYNPGYLIRQDVATIKAVEINSMSEQFFIRNYDTLALADASKTAIKNTIEALPESLPVSANVIQRLTNVHSKMKEPFRRIFGKAYITYTDPMLDTETTLSSNGEAYNSRSDQVIDSVAVPAVSLFNLYDNNLSGSKLVGDKYSQVGWVSSEISNSSGEFGYIATGHQLLNSPYTEANKFTLTATNSDHVVLTDYKVRLEAGKTYVASFESDGKAPNDVEILLLLNKATDTFIRVFDKAGTVFTPAVSGEYYLRFNVNVSGTTFSMWNIMVSEGDYPIPYEPYEHRFVVNPKFTITFTARPIIKPMIYFDAVNGSIITDFIATFIKDDGTTAVYTVTNNTKASVEITSESLVDITTVIIEVYKVSKPFTPAIIIDMPFSSTLLYRGYDDASDLMSIDLLEELTYEDSVEALGGVSANEVTIVLDNSRRDFFFNSGSLVSKQLRRNRKIVPWLGVEVVKGEIEWYTLGTFWSYKWDVPADGLTATVVGFDTIGFLSNTEYLNHHVQVNKSIGQLIEYVLDDAKRSYNFIEYYIDPVLYETIIPYAWFESSSHAAALRRISLCYPMHIYCDRNGVINARPQKLNLEYYYDVWSNDTNVIDKKYSSLYTAVPNVVSVDIISPKISTAELAREEVPFTVNAGDVKIINFSYPYISGLQLIVDTSAVYSYEVYSWGIIITFNTAGTVNSVSCTGSYVDTSTTTTIVRRNEEGVKLDGIVSRNVSAEFIQTDSLARLIIDRLFILAENDKYDAEVDYIGDIALSINDPILLENGIAPDNRYNIKRHQLSWTGSLTGSADLNT